jgi:hypothetical protein
LREPLPEQFLALDSQRPWVIYWSLMGLDLLDAKPEATLLQE